MNRKDLGWLLVALLWVSLMMGAMVVIVKKQHQYEKEIQELKQQINDQATTKGPKNQ